MRRRPSRRNATIPVTPLTSSAVGNDDDRVEIKKRTGVTKRAWEEVVSEEENEHKKTVEKLAMTRVQRPTNQ